MLSSFPNRLIRQRLAAVALAALATASASPASAADAAEVPVGVPVRTVIATTEPIQRVLSFTGSVTAERSAALSSSAAGLVAAIEADAGDRVEAGSVLLALDDELARYQYERDVADETRARQAVSDAKRRLGEVQELATRQTVAESVVRTLESEVIEDEAALARAVAVARLSRGALDRHRLKAPFSGVISSRQVDPGEWITPGSAVFELVSLDRLYVDVQVSEAYLGLIEVGMPVSLQLGSEGSAVLPGSVAATVPVTDPTARTFLLRARVQAPTQALLPGRSATASLSLATGETRVAVPRDAVLRYSDGRSVVWAVRRTDGVDRAEERHVQTGLSFDGQIEILSGVTAGDVIVVAGNESLRADQPVRVLSGAAS